jgi:hypothetical protein
MKYCDSHFLQLVVCFTKHDNMEYRNKHQYGWHSVILREHSWMLVVSTAKQAFNRQMYTKENFMNLSNGSIATNSSNLLQLYGIL